jgi:toxin CptA
VSGRDVPALRLELRASRSLTCALVLAHALAAGAVLVAVPQWEACVAAAAVLLGNGCWALRRHALLLGARAVTLLELRGECECSIGFRDGRRVACRVLGSSHVSTFLMILRLDEPGRHRAHAVVLAPDSAAPDRLRRLRVRLRWTRPHPAPIDGGSAPI